MRLGLIIVPLAVSEALTGLQPLPLWLCLGIAATGTRPSGLGSDVYWYSPMMSRLKAMTCCTATLAENAWLIHFESTALESGSTSFKLKLIAADVTYISKTSFL